MIYEMLKTHIRSIKYIIFDELGDQGVKKYFWKYTVSLYLALFWDLELQ